MPYADPAQKLARDRAYKAARRSELAAKQRGYYRRNRETREAAVKDYKTRHPEMVERIEYANGSNRRARACGAPGKLFARDLKDLRGPCAYCGGEQHTWDHVIPLSRGGANTVDNLVPCCEPCNRSKGSRTPEEWQR